MNSTSLLRNFAPWLAFLILLAFGWRVSDPLHNIPAYGDALEVIWGVEWYHEALFVRQVSPLFDPLIYHPNGWHTAALAHTPLLFFLGSWVVKLGGSSALAYNLLAIVSFVLAFVGARRFFRHYSDEFVTTVTALCYTFMYMRSYRLEGHMNVLFMTALLPWLLLSLLNVLALPSDRSRRLMWQRMLAAGVCWGVMIHFSLYSIFVGAVCFAIGGWRWVREQRLLLMGGIGVVALIVASPLLVLYWGASRAEAPQPTALFELLGVWSAQADTLFLPSLNHPISWIRQSAGLIYQGPINESSLMNMGTISWLLALIALWRIGRQHRRSNVLVRNSTGLLWLMIVGNILALGLILRWNDLFIQTPFFAWVNQVLWTLGHWVKPDLFVGTQAVVLIDKGIPLPGLLLAAIVPFWESARVLSRYAFVGVIGLLGLSAIGLQRLSRPLQWAIALLWLVESLPTPTANLPLPTQAHPAYVWLTQQPLKQGEGIVDLRSNPWQMTAGEILYATRFHGVPTISGVGSFAPRSLAFVQNWLFDDANAFLRPETSYIFSRFGVRYIFFHVRAESDWAAWDKLKANSALHALDCFEPLPEVSPWPFPICVSEIVRSPNWDKVNTWQEQGWSGMEAWGLWAEGTRSQSRWVATSLGEVTLHIKAFPACPTDQPQHILIAINGRQLADHRWQECEEWQTDIIIPAELVRIGWNEIDLTYGYARQPLAQANSGNDSRLLSLGFSEFYLK